MTLFHRVLGMRHSPVSALLGGNTPLPVKARLTALPFRGVLVYDGLISNIKPVSPTEKRRLLERYAAARENGDIVTGLRTGRNRFTDEGADAAPRPFHSLTSSEKNAVRQIRKARREEGMLIFRRAAYTEEDNPGHMVVGLEDGRACSTFCSRRLVPSLEEILRQLIDISKSGRIPTSIAVDDRAVSEQLRVVIDHAGLYGGVYPPSCPEEIAFLARVPPNVLESLRIFGC